MLKVLLYPFSCLYKLVTSARNRLYDAGLRPSVSFDLPVISVGNLTVGGTGKTPMVEYLIGMLKSDYALATLSRGYGRKTTGFRIANLQDDAASIGDEPFQFFLKFNPTIKVSVGEDRAMAIPTLLNAHESLEVIILDDAYQHRKVRPSFSILLSDYYRPFYKDYLLPSGRLRESRTGAQRADVVVVTKCPDGVDAAAIGAIESSIRLYTKKPIFFTSISYGQPVAFSQTNLPFSPAVVLLTGIASPDPLVGYVKNEFQLKEHLRFPDHYTYTEEDIRGWLERFEGQQVTLLTTEKDWVKIDRPEFKYYLKKLSLFYIPIRIRFLKNGEEFDTMVRNHVKSALDKKN